MQLYSEDNITDKILPEIVHCIKVCCYFVLHVKKLKNICCSMLSR